METLAALAVSEGRSQSVNAGDAEQVDEPDTDIDSDARFGICRQPHGLGRQSVGKRRMEEDAQQHCQSPQIIQVVNALRRLHWTRSICPTRKPSPNRVEPIP